MPVTTKELNATKKRLGISPMFEQRSKAVIESLMDGTFDFEGRKVESLVARKLVKMQMKQFQWGNQLSFV